MDKNYLNNEPLTLNFPILSRNSSMKSVKPRPQPWHSTWWRWVALLLMNLLLLGDYVVIDSPQALETQLEAALDLNKQEYSYFYSSWALPSIFIPLVGGYLTDYLGVRPTLILACIGLSIGQFIIYIGSIKLSFTWMLIGRVVYAFGSNPLNVAQMVLIYKWFRGREVALAMAISSTTSCIGRALCSFAVPKIFDFHGTISAPMLFGFLLCIMSTITCIIMCIWDKANDRREFALDPTYDEETFDNVEKVSLKDLKYFGWPVWLLVLNFGLTDGHFFSFNAFSNDFYHIRYNFSNSTAGNIISINYILGAISSVVFGYLVDKYAKRATIIFYNSFFGIIGFLFYVLVDDCSECISTVIPQVLFGLMIGINDAAVFPSLPLVLEEKYLGTGFGLFFVIQNFLIFVLPMAAASITVHTESNQNGYFWMLVFFVVLSCVTTFESFCLLRLDKKIGRTLDTYIEKEDEYILTRETRDDEEEVPVGHMQNSGDEDNGGYRPVDARL